MGQKLEINENSGIIEKCNNAKLKYSNNANVQ